MNEVTILVSFGFRDWQVEIDRSVDTRRLAVVAVGGRGVGRSARSCGLALLIPHFRALVKPIDDGDTFPHAAGARMARGGPSLAFGRFGDVAANLLNFVALMTTLIMIVPGKLHGSHLGYCCAQ